MRRLILQHGWPAVLVLGLLLAPWIAPAATAAAAPAAFTFNRGVVIAHWLGRLSADDPYAADWFDDEDVAWIATQGFDHMSVHVDGHRWIDSDGKLLDEKIAPFERMLASARKQRLGVILTMTSLPGYRTLPWPPVNWPANAPSPLSDAKLAADAQRLWQAVAKRFANAGAELRFELLEGPGTSADAAQLNVFYKALLAAVRDSSPTRAVHLSPPGSNPAKAGEIELPDAHTVLSLDFFEPMIFTMQYYEDRPLVAFPGRVPDLSAVAGDDAGLRALSGKTLSVADVEASIARIAAWAQAQPRKPAVHIGSFGVSLRADDASARNYIRAARSAFERHGFSWTVYDYYSGMAVRDQTGKGTRILEALQLQTKDPR